MAAGVRRPRVGPARRAVAVRPDGPSRSGRGAPGKASPSSLSTLSLSALETQARRERFCWHRRPRQPLPAGCEVAKAEGARPCPGLGRKKTPHSAGFASSAPRPPRPRVTANPGTGKISAEDAGFRLGKPTTPFISARPGRRGHVPGFLPPNGRGTNAEPSPPGSTAPCPAAAPGCDAAAPPGRAPPPSLRRRGPNPRPRRPEPPRRVPQATGDAGKRRRGGGRCAPGEARPLRSRRAGAGGGRRPGRGAASLSRFQGRARPGGGHVSPRGPPPGPAQPPPAGAALSARCRRSSPAPPAAAACAGRQRLGRGDGRTDGRPSAGGAEAASPPPRPCARFLLQ